MNEQLTVKNFGPFKDATVDFKKVTVFIGPTGGGKSTLAKLAAIFRQRVFFSAKTSKELHSILNESLLNYEINNYAKTESYFCWKAISGQKFDVISVDETSINIQSNLNPNLGSKDKYVTHKLEERIDINRKNNYEELEASEIYSLTQHYANEFDRLTFDWYARRFPELIYIPADRLFASAASRILSTLHLQNNSLGRPILKFLEDFSNATRSVRKFPIDFLNATYESTDFARKIRTADSYLDLHESASGIQSVTPMLAVIIDKIYKYKVSMREVYFDSIIEEPELNLYPTAQQGLLNWLISECATDNNGLIVTTHSPYILAHLNLLLYAYEVAEKHPDRADDVAKIVPRESWINPKEFAAYHVEGQKENGVHSIVNPETGLISYNDLDALAGHSATEFDQLLDINAGLEVE